MLTKWIAALLLVLATCSFPAQADPCDLAGTTSPDGRYSFRWLRKKAGVRLCLIETKSHRPLVTLEEWPFLPKNTYPYIAVRWSNDSRVAGFVRQMRKSAEIATISVGRTVELRRGPDDWDKILMRGARPIRWPWEQYRIDTSSAEPLTISTRGVFTVRGGVLVIQRSDFMEELKRPLRFVPNQTGGLSVEFVR